MTSKNIESVIKNLLTKKSPRPVGSLVNYTKHLKNFSGNPSQTLPIKVREEGTHLNSFSEATVTLILVRKPDKDNIHTHKSNRS